MRNRLLFLWVGFFLAGCQTYERPVRTEPSTSVPGKGTPMWGSDALGTDHDAGSTLPETVPPIPLDDAASAEVADTSIGTTPADSGPETVVTTPEPPSPPIGPPACPAPNIGEIDLWVAGQGNCSYAQKGVPEYVAAVDRDLYAGAATCGSCLEVSSSRGTVIATVVDQYPVAPGPQGHKISLGSAALNKVAAPGTSIANLRWRWVPCPVTGSIMAALKDGSNHFYWEVILSSFTNRVAKFEFSTGADDSWKEVKRETYNYFRLTPAKGLPTRLRLTDTLGNVLTTGDLDWPTNPVDAPISLGVQFPPACATR